MLERDFMKNWIGSLMEVNAKRRPDEQRLWFRIPDSASGIKPFDGFLWLSDGRTIAVEFKVWRLKEKRFDYSTVEPHQMKALLDFVGKRREAWIVVYYEHTKKVKIYHPSQRALDRLLKGKK